MYRTAPPTLTRFLDQRLVPLGFVTLEPSSALTAIGARRLYRRKTWNTNRGVVVIAQAGRDLRQLVELARRDAGAFIGSSWLFQLGLQIVVEVDGEPPAPELLARLVDPINTQGVLVQSVFAVDPATGSTSNARTWGQVITARFQDGISAALADLAATLQ